VGIAVGGGAEAALQVADAYLTRPGLAHLHQLLLAAKRTRALLQRNLAVSLVYNLAFGVAAMCGQITPLWAAVLMPISSLSVVGSSLLERGFQTARRSSPG
jgi:cation transport ATPase